MGLKVENKFREYWVYSNEEYAPTYACDFNQRGFVPSRNRESIHTIEIAAVEQLKSDLQITRHKIETLLTINMRQDAEVTGLKSQIKHWEDKEVEKASCCFENEQENISLKSKLKIATEAIEKYTDLHHAPKLEETLKEIGGEI